MSHTILLQPKSKETLSSYHKRIIETYENEAKIAPSRIKNAGHGVFAPYATPAGVVIGYYAGRQVSHDQAARNPSAYILQVAHNTNLERCKVIPLTEPETGPNKSILIDASDKSVANWCSMVNDYRGSGKNPNVMFKKNGALVTITPLRKGEELLLDYGDEYWKAMEECKLSSSHKKVPKTCDSGKCAIKSESTTTTKQQLSPSLQQKSIPKKSTRKQPQSQSPTQPTTTAPKPKPPPKPQPPPIKVKQYRLGKQQQQEQPRPTVTSTIKRVKQTVKVPQQPRPKISAPIKKKHVYSIKAPQPPPQQQSSDFFSW